jgi:hypothetical protein
VIRRAHNLSSSSLTASARTTRGVATPNLPLHSAYTFVLSPSIGANLLRVPCLDSCRSKRRGVLLPSTWNCRTQKNAIHPFSLRHCLPLTELHVLLMLCNRCTSYHEGHQSSNVVRLSQSNGLTCLNLPRALNTNCSFHSCNDLRGCLRVLWPGEVHILGDIFQCMDRRAHSLH